MRSVHVIGLVTGLGSSLPLIGGIWTAWARKLEKRFDKKYPDDSDVVIIRCSSDGSGEAKLFNVIFRLHTQGLLGRVCIAGHSNGVRDSLIEIEKFYANGITVDYMAAIDQALLDDFFSSEAWGNILQLDEFHARLEYVNIHSTFKKAKRPHRIYEVKKGHTAAASDPFVQDRIFQMVCEQIDKGLEE
jgi:hypothetical protein